MGCRARCVRGIEDDAPPTGEHDPKYPGETYTRENGVHPSGGRLPGRRINPNLPSGPRQFRSG